MGSYSFSVLNSEHRGKSKRREEDRGCPNLLFSLQLQNNQVLIFIKPGQKYFKGMAVRAKPISHSSTSLSKATSPCTLVLHHSSSLYTDLCFFLITCFCFYLLLSWIFLITKPSKSDESETLMNNC